MELLYVAFGWLLGQFGQVIMIKFNNVLRRKKVKKTLHVELEDLRYNMAGIAQKAHLRYEHPSREFLKWLACIFGSYSGPEKKRIDIPGMKNELVNLSDSDLNAFYERHRRTNVVIGVPRQYLPYLEQQLDAISLFSIEVQRTLLNIICQLHVLNHVIGSIEWHYKKTFDETVTDENREAIESNIDGLSKDVGWRACYMSNLITDLFNRWNIQDTCHKIRESLYPQPIPR